jgi:hypothetical protein
VSEAVAVERIEHRIVAVRAQYALAQ